MSLFSIHARDAATRARAGTIHLHHGDVRTPAFVPLATKATLKTLEPHEVRALGYDMVLGNTYHLFLTPGAELIEAFGGLHEFMRWGHPIITDSGGFQVFSMGHGTVADEIKGSGRPAQRAGRTLEITEDGVTFRSYIDGSRRFMGPETSMAVQAALGSDIALVFDECTPFNVTRDYTARSTERTHRWLDRCVAWHAEHGPPGQTLYSIVQGGVEEDLRRGSAQAVAERETGGIAIGGSLGAEKAQMYEVVDWTVDELEGRAGHRPRHLLGIGDVDDLIRGVELGIDTFDCAMPTRLGRHGMAIVPDPAGRWRLDLGKAVHRHDRDVLMDGCPCPACAASYSRGYLHYLVKHKEPTGGRLLTLHNLAYLQRLMADLRQAIGDGELAARAAALRAGAAPRAVD